MRKLLFILSLIGGLLSVPTNLMADEGQKKTIRMFLNTGEQLDFDANVIDSMTFTSDAQTIWYDDTCRTVAIEVIDSIWYMTPTLRLTTQSLDFGKVAVGNARTLTAMLTNTSNFMETYMMLGDGPFSVPASAKEIMIIPGESRSIELTFTPTDSIAYSGLFSIASTAVDGGMVNMPLNGEGVATDSLETDVDTPPVEATFDILLQEDEQIEDFTGYKIVNFNGEYELDIPAMARNMRRASRAGSTYNVASANATISSAGLQLHYFTDEQGNPVMYTISLPGEQPEFSMINTAIALLVINPYFAPTDVSDYKNTVSVLRKLKSFDVYVYNLRQEYTDAKRNNRIPDYSKVSVQSVINELFAMSKDNHWLTLSGMSLKDLNVTPQSAIFKLHNDFKRSLSLYASRLKMNESNLVVSEQEEITPTFSDVIIKLTDYLSKLDNTIYKEFKNDFDPDDGPLLGAIQILLKEAAALSADDPVFRKEVPIWLPFIIDSGKSDYWDIVWDAFTAAREIDAPLFSEEGFNQYLNSNEESIFAKDSQEFSFDFRGSDKIQLDIYGLGKLGDKNWDMMSDIEKNRIIFAFAYGAYFDVVKPFIKLVTGLNDVSKRILAEGSEIDLRHGAQKVWLGSLVVKLYNEFRKTPENWTKLYDNAKKGDLAAIGKQFGKFALKEMSKLPKEAEDAYKDPDAGNKCTYINLIYHIGKTTFGLNSTSEAFRKFFKTGANAVLELIGIVMKTTSVCEAAMDVVGGITAAEESQLKETFIIDKYDQPHITPKEPIKVYDTADTNVHFTWDFYIGNNYGTGYLFDLEMIVETLTDVKRTVVLTNLTDTQCDYNLSKLPNAKSARKILYRIIAHHPDRPANNATTDYILLVQNASVPDIPTPEMVDLGLPSGTKWAVCNLGANSAKEPGNYYAWGETEPKTTFSWNNYKFYDSKQGKLTKYCTKSSYGKVDNKTSLEPADDRVKTDYGYYWSIPTKEDWQELIEKCTWSKFGDDFLVRGPNGSIILLPSAGYKEGYNVYDEGKDGYYWATSINEGSPDDAWYMHVKGTKRDMYCYYRYQGRCIRPVQHKANYDEPNTVQ